jgi:hypothetical protein
MESSVAAVTVRTVEPETPSVAVMVVEPTEAAVANPPVAVTLATDWWEEIHVAVEVRSCVVPSE